MDSDSAVCAFGFVPHAGVLARENQQLDRAGRLYNADGEFHGRGMTDRMKKTVVDCDGNKMAGGEIASALLDVFSSLIRA